MSTHPKLTMAQAQEIRNFHQKYPKASCAVIVRALKLNCHTAAVWRVLYANTYRETNKRGVHKFGPKLTKQDVIYILDQMIHHRTRHKAKELAKQFGVTDDYIRYLATDGAWKRQRQKEQALMRSQRSRHAAIIRHSRKAGGAEMVSHSAKT